MSICANLSKVIFLCYVKPAVYGLNIPYHYFKFDSRQPYFMAYCIESLQQPFFNWKFCWRQRDLNPGPSEHPSNVLPTEHQLSCPDGILFQTLFFTQITSKLILCHFCGPRQKHLHYHRSERTDICCVFWPAFGYCMHSKAGQILFAIFSLFSCFQWLIHVFRWEIN